MLFFRKTESAVQGTLVGNFAPKSLSSSPFKSLKDILSACAGSISLIKNETYLLSELRKQSKATGPSDQEVNSSQ